VRRSGSGFAGAVYFMAQLRITPPSAFDPNWANLAIFIVMVGGIGSLEGVLIGAVIYFFADRWFGEYGASYLIVLGPPHSLLRSLSARRALGPQPPDRRRAVVPDAPHPA
jgi:ABC-type branched-subunit amino acid transport system permease subunit